jgi:hypothetical protein
MKLITSDLKKQFAKQGDTSTKDPSDVMVLAKFFCPWNAHVWFATDYYEDTKSCFGYVNLSDDQNAELGYFDIEEMEAIDGPFGLKIERDIHWVPRSLKLVIEKKGKIL